MEIVIVTVTDERNRFSVDLEVPTNLVWKKLKEDIVDTLNGSMPELNLSSYGVSFWNIRRNEVLSPELTLEEAGVWNGDYLIVR